MNSETMQDEVFIAIAMAMHEEGYNMVHDLESLKLTFKRRHICTSWNTKTQTMRELPNRY